MKRVVYLIVASLLVLSCTITNGRSAGDETKSTLNNTVLAGAEVGVGDPAPEMVLESPDGKQIALSSLRGKMVLIDFWAAWCPPCRRENPKLVKTYLEYKDKEFINGTGFTVYSVSLDRKKEDWIAAIEKDGLVWESHVSDLLGWKSAPASLYAVTGIPMNFLIDGDGIIVSMNLRGSYLDSKLKSFLK